MLAAVFLPSFSLAKEKGFTVVVDSRLTDQGSVTVWMGYLLARAKYRDDQKIPLPASGDILPSFQEEVYARAFGAQIYQEWKAENKGWSEPYWEILSEIKAKGFMDAYVWTYLHQANWSKSEQPGNLTAFRTWSAALLKNHEPETHGALVLDRK